MDPTIKYFWQNFLYPAVAIVVAGAIFLIWLRSGVPESSVLDTSTGREGSQFTMTVPKKSVTSDVVAIFTDVSGLRYNGKAEVVGVEGETRKIRVTVPSGICDGLKFSTKTVQVTISDEHGTPAPGAETPAFTVACGS